MSSNDFICWFENNCQQGLDYIVSIKIKYDHEQKFRFYNVVLCMDWDGVIEWSWDWYEGEECVEFIACIPVQAIDFDRLSFIPDYDKIKEIKI